MPIKTRKTRIPTQIRSKEKVDRLIHAARDLFSQKGFAKTTMAQIAKKAGVSTGTAYAYFSDKGEVLQKVLQEHVEEILHPAEEIMANLPRNADVKSTLKKIINCFIKVQKQEFGLQNIFFERRLTDENFRKFVIQYRERGREIGRQLVTKFGSAKAKRNKEATAQVIVGLLDFCVHIGRVFPSDVTVEQACRVGIEMITSYFKR